MKPISQFFRLFYISFVLMRHGLDGLVLNTPLFRPFRVLKIFMPWLWWSRKQPRGERIRLALEDLGPIFIKFGQILSTRRDLLPDDIAEELTRLQDQVPPFSDQLARTIIERELGESIDAVFANFEATPFASASIAQVHGATLHGGQDVVVKVLRPDILPVIKRDIGLMYLFANAFERYWAIGRQLHAVEVVSEFEKTILDELDLTREAANASQLRRNFIDSPLLYVPEVYWDYCRRNVMVMERIAGVPIGHTEQLRQANINLKALAEHGVEIFFTQVFRDSFFHADMHPGNIFVSNEGQYLAVDFGIMGSLNPSDQRYLAENFHAFFNRDYRRVAQLHIDSGWIDRDTRIDEFESAIRTVCEPIFNKPLSQISFGHLLLRLFQTARRFNMEVQPQLVLLQKTLLNIEGLGRQLYPELDLWQTAKPFLERWIREQIGPRAFIKHLRINFPMWAERLPQLPNMVYDVLEQAKNGNLNVELQERQIRQLRQEMRRNNRRTWSAIVGASLILSATILAALDGYAKTMLGNLPLYSWLLGGAGLAILLAAWPDYRDD
ncbi:ubiquinone biosynthesis regulatory protein kinase UbiB [Thiohalophilus thiocyanatoxydans]|uniref:Probable protein kinase UbiB n=1 Tax=Thiohalophilus thiocyanatoxydans TaxID=381308 RepID=A0A4R8J0D3_9GAMM|nr:ubiquinone biosynthesis regulatory protein kinase UbiB [Thiohalophilus thiocyanatoxydans]TDY03747.1 2-octaprenylphenol hydroxylase [Thiohalophilus thiocyanatoxydans]